MKKILLTGGSGFLGSRIRYFYDQEKQKEWEIYSPTHQEMDMARPGQISDYVTGLKPDIVIHCGTVADTEYVAQYPRESFQITVEGSCHLAETIKQLQKDVSFLLMSSDYVYQDKTISGISYNEKKDALKEDEAGTQNEYGRQKLEAERRCMEIYPHTIALRLTWMYDLPAAGLKNKPNFLTNLLEMKKENKPLTLASHEYRGITSVWEVVKNLEKAATLPGGSYNFGSSNSLSTFRLGKELAVTLGLPEALLMEDDQRYADHPRNLTMNLEKVRKYDICFSDTLEGMQCFLPSRLL
ncbi:MAG: sugar nucleotide-binding protein [Lachnospiraceae bacterium]|nr:sugar nucleotide-binding protein [Lachnospiraceae bacterium]